jgi:hypothetical protein
MGLPLYTTGPLKTPTIYTALFWPQTSIPGQSHLGPLEPITTEETSGPNQMRMALATYHKVHNFLRLDAGFE